MQLSLKMIVLAFALLLSEVCVNLDTANNRNQYFENDDSEDTETPQDYALHTISSKWVENPEA
ncbi:MAG: hypothetical protein ACK4V2_01240 [Pseudomonadota bacterium]|nr:hypothetical protein [Alphaproteobacteria bacterium]